jgi:hypothetical protein
MNVYRLADRLGKTVGEILEMPMVEYIGWIAFSHIEDARK